MTNRGTSSNWEHLWQQVPAENRHETMRSQIEAASPRLAIAMFKDLFMVNNPAERGMVCAIPGPVLLPLLMELYALKQGPDPEAEQALWAKVLQIDH